MKKLLTIIVAVLLFAGTYAQSPQKMSYQAVVRDASNALVTTQVGMKISILQGAESGTPVYVETQTPTPNVNGLVSIEIGGGTPVIGTFSVIDWSAGPYFIKTETAPTAPLTTYTITGSSQLLSVPYALYAQKAHDIDYNFIITGISDITLNRTKTISILIFIHWISGEQKNVTLSASDVPTGVTLQFEKSDGKPDFASKLDIEVTKNAVAGLHNISIIGTAENGKIRIYSFELNILTTLSAELTIKDGTTWSVVNPSLDNVQNATVKLFANQSSFDNNLPDFTATSDVNGIVKLYDLPIQEQYFLVVEKGDLKNIVDGYIITGVFQNQAEIESSSEQTGAQVGGLKYTDVNADGIINSDDKTWHDYLSVYENETTTKTITIGN
jgi:hypothetical protein